MSRSFNGTTDVITANPIAFTGTHDSALVSVSVWCLITALGGDQRVFNDGGTSDGFYIYASSAGDSNHWGVNLNGNGFVSSGLSLTLNKWANIVFTYNGPVAHDNILYLNGSSIQNTFANCTFPATTTFNIGSGLGGRIADVACWDGVILNSFEIAALAAGVRPNRIRPNKLVGYWPLFGTASPEPDLSGNANNGVLTGTALGSDGPPVSPFTPRRPQFLTPPVFHGTLSVDTGFCALAGKAAGLIKTSKLVLPTGFYSQTGKRAAIVPPTKNAAIHNAFVLGMGNLGGAVPAQGPVFLGVSAATGSYSLNGKASTLAATRKLLLGTGSYLVAGKDVKTTLATGFIPPSPPKLFGIDVTPGIKGIA